MPPNSPQQPLLIYYKTTLGISFLIIGAIALAFSIWMAVQSQAFSALALLGLIILVFGVFCLNRPYFLLESRQITVYNLLGMEAKRYTFESWEYVKADSKRIYIDDNGITKKVAVAPWLVKTDDWTAVRNLL